MVCERSRFLLKLASEGTIQFDHLPTNKNYEKHPANKDLDGEDAVLLGRWVLSGWTLSGNRSRSRSRSRFIHRGVVRWVAEAVLTGMTSLTLMELAKEREMFTLIQAKGVSLIESVETTILGNDKVRKGCFDSCIGGDLRIEKAVEPWVRSGVGADSMQEMVKDEKRRELGGVALLELTEGGAPLIDESLRLV